VVVGKNGGDSGLLAHEFGDCDGIGFGGGSPREGSMVVLVPAVKKGQRALDFRIEECAGGPRVQRHG
jgi:hypothetical protein